MGLIPVTGSLPHPSGVGSGNVLWVVDADHSFFDALTWMDQLEDDTVRISNVSQVVRAAQNRAITKSKGVDFLALFGHGTGGYQSAGAGRRLEETGTQSLYFRSISRPGESLLMGRAEQTLSALNGVLADDAKVLLAGCNVGEGDRGTGLLTTVSKCLKGRTVQAFENAVYWWTGYLIGTMKVAVGDNVSTSFESISL
jgi:hypothetical protein